MSTKDRICEFVEDFWDRNGYAPSVREIGDGVGLRSTYSVHHHLVGLMREGRIARVPGKQRTVRVVG